MKRFALSTLLFLFVLAGLCSPTLAQELGGEPVEIKIDPMSDVNPVKTQHTFVATVLDANGNPLPNQRVEWILSRGPKAVGDIVDHDDKDSIFGTNEPVQKLSNHYTVSYTNEGPEFLDKGTETTEDDVDVKKGQTWCTITSPFEGETHVIAYCPQIRNHDKHKVFAIKYWIDARLSWPKDATNRVGEPHTFNFQLTKASTDTPLVGYRVNWKLLPEGPAGQLGQNQQEVETATNQEGKASVTLTQTEEKPGVNTIEIELISPEGKLLATRTVTKTWIAPFLEIQKDCPPEGIVGEVVPYTFVVTNTGAAAALNVTVKDTVPEGVTYKSSSIEPQQIQGKMVTWSLGDLAPNETRTFTMDTTAVQVGTYTTPAQVFSDRGPGPQDDATVTIGAPDVYIIKEGPPEVRLGNVATYTLTVKNRGDRRAKNVTVVDNIPQGMSYQGRTAGFALRWPPIPVLAPGEEKKYNYSLQTVNVGTFTNEALVVIRKKIAHKANFTTKVVAPEIAVTKDVRSRIIYRNKSAHFDIVVKNEGTGVARDVRVVDTIPALLDYVNSSPAGRYLPAQGEQLAAVNWELGDLKPGEERKIELELRGKEAGTCQNTVKVTSEDKIVEDSAQLRIKGVSAMHLQSYDTNDPVEVGKRTIYFIEARNEGTSPCTNVRMVNVIPEEMRFISAEGPTDYKLEGERRVVFDPVPVLQPTEKLTYKIVCEVVDVGAAKGSAKNQAILSYDQFKKDIIDEEGTSVYE